MPPGNRGRVVGRRRERVITSRGPLRRSPPRQRPQGRQLCSKRAAGVKKARAEPYARRGWRAHARVRVQCAFAFAFACRTLLRGGQPPRRAYVTHTSHASTYVLARAGPQRQRRSYSKAQQLEKLIAHGLLWALFGRPRLWLRVEACSFPPPLPSSC